MALSIWTPSGIVDVGNGGPAYSAGNNLTNSYNSSNTSLFSPKTPSAVSIPDQVIGGGSADNPTQSLVTPTTGWYPGVGNDPVVTSPTNVGNPSGYGMQNISDWNSGADPFNQEENYSYVDTSSRPNPSPSGGGGGGGYSGPAPIPEALISQDLTRRPQTGNIYAPDLSAYNDSSLFNYTGPGGVDEYTYGQGLRTDGADYSIFGSPTDIANPYYEGQFAPKPTGPADGAINMNPVQLPSDLPQIEVSADVSMPGFVGGGNQVIGGSLPTDLTYQQTIDEMGIFGPDNPPPSTTFPSPGDNTGLTQNMTASDKEYQDMLNQSLMMDNQLMNQLDSSKPVDSSMMDNQTQADMAMGDRSGFPNNNRVIEASIPGMTMDDTAAIEQGMMQGTPNPQSGLPVTQFGDVPQKTLTPLQQAARDASSNIDTRDFRFNPTGEQDKSLLQKWVESGPAYQPTSDSTIAEMEAMGNQVKSFADKTAQVRNLFDETVINTVGSPNQFEIQRAEADANQAALDKQRYNTQINNPTADFSGYMKNYGSGFKEPAPVNVNFDSSLDPSNQASNYPPTIFTGSPSAGIDANTAQEIAARTEAMNAPDGNELMLEAIGLGSNLFNEVSKAEKEQAQKDMVNIFANAYNKTQDQPKPAVIKTTSKKPEPKRVTVKYNQNKPVKVAKTKPTGRGPQPFTPTRTTGSRSARRLTGGR